MSDIILLSISVLSFGGIAYIISRKVPFLLAVPENIINESFVVRPSKAKVYFERLKSYFIERKFEIPALSFFEWFFWKIRIIFLRCERISFLILKNVQRRKQFLRVPRAQREYLEERSGIVAGPDHQVQHGPSQSVQRDLMHTKKDKKYRRKLPE
ncbi:MAG: hypothetical protein A2934_03265 [Candidatus Sungbacteria bacterium RIFCSPLOWO2_01_FULL_47_10]|uniref:Uncharacterized protein n=1 Tax=Candidatus Sungbacteria bacterium RIFCSPLOWO2_01_FULL_47_10 TaxID=1802276 RepID=A0A1G2L5Z3_9BACT|nr:MAG: hypothetical protein A2934_03265 [Candidatus Sungbacteria bacterium RIFCSPLOWO2_01_FULL_47_10]